MKKFKEDDRVIVVSNYDRLAGLIGFVVENRSSDPEDYIRVFTNRNATFDNTELFEENDLELFPENKILQSVLHRIENLEATVSNLSAKIEYLEDSIGTLREKA